MKSVFFFFLVTTKFYSVSFGQSQLNFKDLYQNNIPLFQDIVSGGYYVDQAKYIEGHPYFESRNLESGLLTINGITYQDVPLSYNIFTDELITFQPIHKQKILIRSDKINAFEIKIDRLYHFVLIANNPDYLHHNNGIYELLESGQANLLCKHYKMTKDKRELSIYSDVFYEKSDYFLQKNDKIMLIKKPKQAFKFLELDRKTLKSRLRENDLNFRNNPATYLGFLTKEFNQQ